MSARLKFRRVNLKRRTGISLLVVAPPSQVVPAAKLEQFDARCCAGESACKMGCRIRLGIAIAGNAMERNAAKRPANLACIPSR
jgi:hypothetical protein